MESIRFNPRQTLLAALVAATLCTPAMAAGSKVSWDDIRNDDKTTGDVLTYGLGLKAQRHSTMETINTANVANLVPAWSFSFGGNGFFFVTDREKLATGAGYPNKPTSLIGAWPFVDGITWASGFDLKTGRPIEKGNRPPALKPGADKAIPSSSRRLSSAVPTGTRCRTARKPACSVFRPTTGAWTTGPST